MARLLYGNSPADFTITPTGRLTPGAVLTVWTAVTGGTQVTDLTDYLGTASTVVTSDSAGLVRFYGPDGTDSTLWLDSGQGTRLLVRPVNLPTAGLDIGTVTTGTAGATLTPDGTDAWTLDLVLPTAGANGVNTAAIQSKAVTAAKIADDTITATQIAANAVGASELADNAVDTAAIADSAVTSAKIADGTITATDVAASTFAAHGTVGNLLTANVASGTDTLGDTTGFRASGATIASSTAQAYQGSRSLAITATSTGGAWGIVDGPRAPVTAGDAYTVVVRLRSDQASGETAKVYFGWFTAASGGSAISTTTADRAAVSISSSGWTYWSVTAVAPATAAYAEINIMRVSGANGAVTYADTLSAHRGASGQWAMPGTPITGLSEVATNGAVHLSGTGAPEGAVTAPPGSTWLQIDSTVDVKGWIRWIKATGTGNTGWQVGPEADTGTRLVAVDGPSWSGNVHVRRRGNIVEVKPDASRLTMPAAGTDLVMTLPLGFRAIGNGFTEGMSFNHVTNYVFPILMSSGGAIYYYASTSRSAGNTLSFTLVFQTADAWPSSLSGTAA